MKSKHIDDKQALQILGNTLSDVAIGTVTCLMVLSPQLVVLLFTARGIYSAWGEFGQARLNELLEALKDDVEDFKKEIIVKDEFKGLFLNVLEKHMRETSSKKRNLLRRYLISVAKGKKEGYSNHTKLLLIMDQITADELRLFMLLPTIIEDFKLEAELLGSQLNDLNVDSAQINLRLHKWKMPDGQIERLLRFLGNYGLVVTVDYTANTLGGGISSLQFKGLTDSGWTFYKFLDNPSIDKTIK